MSQRSRLKARSIRVFLGQVPDRELQRGRQNGLFLDFMSNATPLRLIAPGLTQILTQEILRQKTRSRGRGDQQEDFH